MKPIKQLRNKPKKPVRRITTQTKSVNSFPNLEAAIAFFKRKNIDPKDIRLDYNIMVFRALMPNNQWEREQREYAEKLQTYNNWVENHGGPLVVAAARLRITRERAKAKAEKRIAKVDGYIKKLKKEIEGKKSVLTNYQKEFKKLTDEVNDLDKKLKQKSETK